MSRKTRKTRRIPTQTRRDVFTQASEMYEALDNPAFRATVEKLCKERGITIDDAVIRALSY